MIHVPARFSYAELYLTLKCQLHCSYCVNAYSGVVRKRKELTAREWVLGINNIDTTLPITLGGGEPTFRKDFYEIVDGIDKGKTIDLLTNGMAFDLDEFIVNIPAKRFTRKGPEYKSIRISYPAGRDMAGSARPGDAGNDVQHGCSRQ